MRESKKKRALFKRVSFWVPTILLTLFVYVNLQELRHQKQPIVKLQKMQIIRVIAPLPWKDPNVPADISESVYFGRLSDLNRPLIIQDSGEYLPIKVNDSREKLECIYCTISNPRIVHISSIDKDYIAPKEVLLREKLGVILLDALKYLPENIGIAYYGGYQSLADCINEFDNKFMEIYKQTKDPSVAFRKTEEIVATCPISGVPNRSTGAVIGITLFVINKDGSRSLIDMGSKIGEYGIRSATFANSITLDQRNNRLMMLKALTKVGMVNYGMEWWTYSIGDKMWSYLNGLTSAEYGTIGDGPLYQDEEEYIKYILSKIENDSDSIQSKPNSTNAVEENLEQSNEKAQKSVEQAKSATVESVKPPENVKNTQEKPTEAKNQPGKDVEIMVSKNMLIPKTVGEFDSMIKVANRIVLVQLTADWCKYCKNIQSDMNDIADNNKDVSFVRLDIDILPDVRARYGVRSIPSFLLFYQNNLVQVIIGSDKVAYLKESIVQLKSTIQEVVFDENRGNGLEYSNKDDEDSDEEANSF